MMAVKVAIVGSRKYLNRVKIKEFIHQLKRKIGDELVIVSGDHPDGADKFAKVCSLELNVEFKSFPPAHYQWNCFCVKESFYYNKPYRLSNYFARNSEIVEYSDVVACFVVNGDIESSKGTYDTYKKAKKAGKSSIVFD